MAISPLTYTDTPKQQQQSSGGYSSGGGGYYGGGGYGGGGSGGSSGPTDEQKKAGDNLAAIVGYNADTLKNKAKQGDKAFDIADEQSKLMKLSQTKQNKRNAGNDWYTRQQKLQSVSNWLADASGNAMYGSFYNDLNDLIARQDDMDDVEVLNQMRENQNQVDNDYYEAIMANNNSRNELYMDTEANLRELAADYAAQLNNIHPDLAKDMIDKDGKTLKIPYGSENKNDKLDFLNTAYFDSNVRSAIEPELQGLYRPEDAASEAYKQGLVNRKNTSQNNDSANRDYWSRVRQGYQRRSQ